MGFKPLSRRTLLRGTGGIAVALPLLDAMEAHAQSAPPVRAVFCVNFDGTYRPAWIPKSTSGTTLGDLGTILSPLTPWKSRILQLDGINNQAAVLNTNGDGHPGGAGSILTGRTLQQGSVYTGGGGSSGWADGISIDQHLAKTVGKNDRFPTLTLACRPENVTVLSHISYTGPAQPVPPMADPVEVFNKLFTNFTPPGSGGTTTPPPEDPALAALRARRKSVLDAVLDSMNVLSGRVGAADRAKIDQHATSIRELELRLTTPPDTDPDTTMPPSSTGCSKPAKPATLDYNSSANFDKASAAMIDLTVLALACGMTRSVSLQWARSTSGLTFPWLGINEGQHKISHMSDAAGGPLVTKINQWFAGQFATLIDKLSKVQEGSGTLLDNTILYWGNGLAHGANHTQKDVPFVLAGGGGFKYGRYLKFTGASHNGILIAILNKMGVPDTNFGDPRASNGPLPNLS